MLVDLGSDGQISFSASRMDPMVVDVGPSADWVKVNVRQTVRRSDLTCMNIWWWCCVVNCIWNQLLTLNVIYAYAQKDCFEIYALVPGLLREEVWKCLPRHIIYMRMHMYSSFFLFFFFCICMSSAQVGSEHLALIWYWTEKQNNSSWLIVSFSNLGQCFHSEFSCYVLFVLVRYWGICSIGGSRTVFSLFWYSICDCVFWCPLNSGACTVGSSWPLGYIRWSRATW